MCNEQINAAKKETEQVDLQINDLSTNIDNVQKNVPVFQPMLKALGAEKDAAGGRSFTKALLRNDTVLRPDSAVASSMQKLTGCELTANDISSSQKMLLHKPSGSKGGFGAFKYGNETAINIAGKTVNKNCQIVGRAKMEDWIAKNVGIAKRNAIKRHNLRTGIPLAARDHPGVYSTHTDGFVVAETPKGWPEEKHGYVPYKLCYFITAQSFVVSWTNTVSNFPFENRKFADWGAKLMKFKSMDDMKRQLSAKRNELHGMSYKRIYQGKEVPSMLKLSPANRALVNKTAGYKFYYHDDNNNRYW